MSKRSADNIRTLKRLARQFASLELKYKYAKEDGRKIDADRLTKKAERIQLRVEHLKAAIQHRAKMDALKTAAEAENVVLELETLMIENDYVQHQAHYIFGGI